MTKFMNKTFNSPANNQSYRDNWDAVFADTPEMAQCGECGQPAKVTPPWPKAFCSLKCERAFYAARGDGTAPLALREGDDA